ncbi:MAG: hypothetical protein ABI383_15650 [Acidobacteriaceae bacterium]
MPHLNFRKLANKFTPDELLLAIILALLVILTMIISFALFHVHP